MCLPKKKRLLGADTPIIHRCWICGGSVEPNEKEHEGCLEIYNRILKKREEILNLEWNLFLKSYDTVYDNHDTR